MYHILLFAAAAVGPDLVSACRQAHEGDATAHIACLEHALRAHAHAAHPASVSKDDQLGAEHVRAAERRKSEAPLPHANVEIVATSYMQSGRGVFEMADGQVWRETEAAPMRHRLEPTRRYTARIERGVLGGYRMYVEGVTRMIKLERIK